MGTTGLPDGRTAGSVAPAPGPHGWYGTPSAALFFLVWLTAVFAAYYGVQKIPAFPALPTGLPLSPAADALAATARATGVAAWIAITAWLLGAAIVRAAGESRLGLADNALLRTATQTALGFGALGLLVFGTGLAGALNPAALAALLVAAGLVGLVFAVTSWSRGSPESAAGTPPRPPAGGRLFGGLTSAFVVAALTLAGLAALGPPVEWDALTYHLTGPKLYLEAGRIVPHVGPHFAFPALVGQVYTSALALGGDVAARLIAWVLAVCLALALAGLSATWFPRAPHWLAPALFFSLPTAALLAGWAYVDLALTLYTVLALHFVMRFRSSGEAANLMVAAIFAGLCLGVKYTGAFSVAGLLAVLVWRAPRNLRALAGFLLVAGAVAAPWYVKNLVWYGNPIYPALGSGVEAGAALAGSGPGFWQQPWRLVLAPLEMTILGREGSWGYQATLGPLLLALAPLSVLRRRNPKMIQALVFLATFGSAWLLALAVSQLFQQSRLIFPAFGVMALALSGAVAAVRLWDRPALRVSRVVQWAVGLALALSLWQQIVWFAALWPLGVALGGETRDAYLARTLGGHYEAARTANDLTAGGGAVLPLYEPRGYYLERVARPDVGLDTWHWALQQGADDGAIADALTGVGIRYLLLDRGGLAFLSRPPQQNVSPPELAALERFLASEAELIWGEPLVVRQTFAGPRVETSGSRYSIYRLAR